MYEKYFLSLALFIIYWTVAAESESGKTPHLNGGGGEKNKHLGGRAEKKPLRTEMREKTCI